MSDNILESDLARELGLTKDEMRTVRKKYVGAGEFSLGTRGKLQLTADAANRIRVALGAAKKEGGGELPLIQDAEFSAEKKGGPEPAPSAPVTLWVKAIPRNVHILECCLNPELDGGVVRVRVKANVNFVRRMEIRARLESGSLYSLVGRCPRYRGRF